MAKAKLKVEAVARIHARPDRVYGIIADYRNGHPHILPPEFSGLTIEQGGVGDGTIIRFQMQVFGMTEKFRAAVTEPEPGRVLVETDLDTNGAVTQFIVDPNSGGMRSDVTICTELPVRTGVLGTIERFLTARYLRSIYMRQLALLAARAEAGVDC